MKKKSAMLEIYLSSREEEYYEFVFDTFATDSEEGRVSLKLFLGDQN